MFQIFPAAVLAYVLWRFVWPMPWRRRWKCLAAAALLLVSQYYLLARIFFGSPASPEIPYAAMLVCGWLFGAFALLAILLLLKDVAALSLALLRHAGIGKRLTLGGFRCNYALGIAALLLGAVGVWQATGLPEIRAVEIRSSRLPKEWDGLRVVQLTDLHASRLFQAPWMRAVVERVNATNPDLVLITGDIVDGTVAARTNDVAPLMALKAKYGVFAALGNHEYYSDFGRWPNALTGLGLKLLVNQHAVIWKQGVPLVLAGVSDKVATNFGAVPPDTQSALAGKPPGAYTILMAHRPGDAEANAKLGVDLQVSGHTHGGQILGLHWLVQLANNGFVSGLYKIGESGLYVSNGAGLWAGFPLRLGCPAEISLITLRRE